MVAAMAVRRSLEGPQIVINQPAGHTYFERPAPGIAPSLDTIKHDLNETLTHIPVTTTFWQLQAKDFGERPPAPDTVSWWAWRAWALLMGPHGFDRAITHKLLHRKRPWLFPMLDSVTTHLGGFRAWATIWGGPHAA
jgi:hypothetical protein